MTAILTPEQLQTTAAWIEIGKNMAAVAINELPLSVSSGMSRADVLVTQGDAWLQVDSDGAPVDAGP